MIKNKRIRVGKKKCKRVGKRKRKEDGKVASGTRPPLLIGNHVRTLFHRDAVRIPRPGETRHGRARWTLRTAWRAAAERHGSAAPLAPAGSSLLLFAARWVIHSSFQQCRGSGGDTRVCNHSACLRNPLITRIGKNAVDGTGIALVSRSGIVRTWLALLRPRRPSSAAARAPISGALRSYGVDNLLASTAFHPEAIPLQSIRND